MSKLPTLVFPPRTSPTYAPLGIATLSAMACQSMAMHDVYDWNLDLWQALLEVSPDGLAASQFFRTDTPLFWHETTYSSHREALHKTGTILRKQQDDSRRYVETGILDSQLQASLDLAATRLVNGERIIGFSVIFPEQLSFALALAKYLKESCGSQNTCLIGGAFMSVLNPAIMLTTFPYIDGLLCGEGDQAFSAILNGAAFGEVPGLWHRHEGSITQTPSAPFLSEINSLPSPWYGQLRVPSYFNPTPVLSLAGSRGCRWNRCRFCMHNASFGKHRRMDANILVSHMELISQQTGCHHFYLADQYVTPQQLDELATEILTRGLACYYHIMARSIPDYTPEILEKAAMSGCCWISWGMESGSQKLLDLMNKGTQVDTAEQVIINAHAAGISNLLMMIFGSPGSTVADLELTFAFLDRIYPFIDAMTNSAFALFADTPFSRKPQRYGLEVLNQEVLFSVNGLDVLGPRLSFRREGEEDRIESSLGTRELDLWLRRRVWLGEKPFLEGLCCEHFLLHSARRRSCDHPATPPAGSHDNHWSQPAV